MKERYKKNEIKRLKREKKFRYKETRNKEIKTNGDKQDNKGENICIG